MKKNYTLKLAMFVAILIGSCLKGYGQTPITFTYTGSIQPYTVTPGTFSIVVDAIGPKGGTNASYGPSRGGYGGRLQCTIATTPGQVLYLFVGQAGTDNTCCSGGAGGWNGGAAGSQYGCGGGGATDIRIDGTALSNRIIVAGGGGGAGYNCGG